MFHVAHLLGAPLRASSEWQLEFMCNSVACDRNRGRPPLGCMPLPSATRCANDRARSGLAGAVDFGQSGLPYVVSRVLHMAVYGLLLKAGYQGSRSVPQQVFFCAASVGKCGYGFWTESLARTHESLCGILFILLSATASAVRPEIFIRALF